MRVYDIKGSSLHAHLQFPHGAGNFLFPRGSWQLHTGLLAYCCGPALCQQMDRCVFISSVFFFSFWRFVATQGIKFPENEKFFGDFSVTSVIIFRNKNN
jgi:hypothetical protein